MAKTSNAKLVNQIMELIYYYRYRGESKVDTIRFIRQVLITSVSGGRVELTMGRINQLITEYKSGRMKTPELRTEIKIVITDHINESTRSNPQ